MKKLLDYLPYILFTLGFVSFILPVVYDENEYMTVKFNVLELIFGSGDQNPSVGLLIVLGIFIAGVVFSIVSAKKNSNFCVNMAIVLTLTSGVLLFFTRMLANPSVTNLKVHLGLFLPGILIILGTIIFFINKKVLNKKGE